MRVTFGTHQKNANVFILLIGYGGYTSRCLYSDSLGLGGGVYVQRFFKYYGEIDSARLVTVLYNGRSGGGNKLPKLT